jgi:ribosomal protein S27E
MTANGVYGLLLCIAFVFLAGAWVMLQLQAHTTTLTSGGLREVLWPSDTTRAKLLARNGAFAAFCSASLPILYVLLKRAGPSSLVDTIIGAGLGFLILRMSRAAALAALLLFVIGRATAWHTTLPTSAQGFAVAVVFLLFYLAGVLGTFDYHRLARTPTPPKAQHAEIAAQRTHCPHCGARGVSPIRKVFLSPSSPVACTACGRRVSVPWIGTLTVLPFLLAIYCADFLEPFTFKAALWVVGLTVMAFLQVWWVPLKQAD